MDRDTQQRATRTASWTGRSTVHRGMDSSLVIGTIAPRGDAGREPCTPDLGRPTPANCGIITWVVVRTTKLGTHRNRLHLAIRILRSV